MEIVTDRYGRLGLVPEHLLYSEHPSDFLSDHVYEERVQNARWRVLNAVGHLRRTANGKPTNTEIFKIGSDLIDLAIFIDNRDAARSRRVLRHNGHTHFDAKHKPRSPQHMSKRRRSLFSLDDIPGAQLFFPDCGRYHRRYQSFIDLMRWHLIYTALDLMVEAGELWCVNGIWNIRVSTMDEHNQGRKSARRVKRDDRSFHGRPNRDRYVRVVA